MSLAPWILVVLFSSYPYGFSVVNVPMQSDRACIAAREAIQKKWKRDYVDSACVATHTGEVK